jgi:peptidoglycan/LPS O-acetylase OafA/YrhL
MTAMLIATTVAATWILLPHDMQGYGQSLVAQGIGLANFYFWSESGYFAGQSEIKPLLHMWSLAVEEQFYVLMPLFFIVAARLRPSIRLAALLALAAGSFGFSVAFSRPYPESSFYLLHTRAWELLFGGIASQLVHRIKLARPFSEVLSAAGLLTILASMFVISTRAFPGWRAAIPCLGTVAVLVANTECKTLVSRLLSLRPLVFVGLISYSLYLWHWPPFAFANYLKVEPLSAATRATLLILAFVCAVASWRLIETPFRSGRFWQTSKATAVGFATCASMVVAIGLGIQLAKGLPGRFVPQALALAEARTDRNPDRGRTHDRNISTLETTGLPRLDAGGQETAPTLVIVGDSHCDAMMPAFQSLVEEYGIPTVAATRSATLPMLYCDFAGERGHFLKAISRYVDRTPSVTNLVLVGRWTEYNDWFTKQNWQASVEAMLGNNRRVWVVLPLPEVPYDVPRALALNFRSNAASRLPRLTKDAFKAKQDEIRPIFDAVSDPHLTYVDLSGTFFGQDDRLIVCRSDRPLYFDDDHISRSGAMLLVPDLRPVFSAIAGEASPPSQSIADE